MHPAHPSRRGFLRFSGGAVGGAWLLAHLPTLEAASIHARRAARDGQAFEILTADEAAELEAMAARILPTDDTPGAVEAGVIHFIDRALGTFAAGQRDGVAAGVAALPEAVSAVRPGASRFAELDEAAQDEVLRWLVNEQPGFFFGVRFLVLAGMFATPARGGNRDGVGWALLGFDDRHVWEPPFGHYDAQGAVPGEGRP